MMRRSNSAFHERDDDVVILLPDLRTLRLIARSVFLAVAIVTFPWLHAIIAVPMQPEIIKTPKWVDEPVMLPTLVEDLKREGLFDLKLNNLFLGDPGSRVSYLKENEMILVDLECMKALVGDDCVDFVMAGNGLGEIDFRFVDRVLKVGGIVVVRLVEYKGRFFRLPGNYRMVYIKRFGSTILGIKKISHVNVHSVEISLNGRKLLSSRKLGANKDRFCEVTLMQMKIMIIYVQDFIKKLLYGNEYSMDVGQRKLLSSENLNDDACMSNLMLTRMKKTRMPKQTIAQGIVDIEINLHGILDQSKGLLVVKSDDGAHLYDISMPKRTKKVTIHVRGNGFLRGKKLLFVAKLKEGAVEKMRKGSKKAERYFLKVQSDDGLLQEVCIEVDYVRKNWAFVLMNAKGKVVSAMEKMKKIWMVDNMMDESGFT